MSESITIDALIADLESRGLGWSLDHHGGLIEARVWNWPYVVGRYRPPTVEPLADMLARAMYEVDFTYYVKLAPGEHIKPYHRNGKDY